MKKIATRKLSLTTETLCTLSPVRLAAVRGGTDLVTVDDPITAPGGGGLAITTATCYCKR